MEANPKRPLPWEVLKQHTANLNLKAAAEIERVCQEAQNGRLSKYERFWWAIR